MEENVINTENEELNLAEMVKDYKENYVPKEKYEKVTQDYNNLVKSVLNGEEIAVPKDRKELEDRMRSLLEELNHPDNYNDIQYMDKMLQWRDVVMELGYADPAAPNGIKIHATEADEIAAENWANYHKAAIEYADGSNSAYIGETQRRMVESGLPSMKKR